MAFCLPEKFVNEFLKRLKSGEINPVNLVEMNSGERRRFFADFLGETNAKQVNALLESKLILKNRERGIINWAKTIGGLKPEVRRDLLARVERAEEILTPEDEDAFLEDLAEKRLGLAVTAEEAGKITELAQEVAIAKDGIDRSSPNGSQSRLEYGMSLTLFQDYVSSLKTEAKKFTFKEYLTSPKRVVVELASASKSLLASLDNSFYGRQGIKVLFTKPSIWAKDFAKSWVDIGRSLKGADALNMIKADVFSRENALNGKYLKGRYDLGIMSEEAFPSSLPEKIPGLGKLFKASETAFNGGALRMRADLADLYIDIADTNGVDTLDKEQAEPIGRLVNSMTGRGGIGKLGAISEELNVLFFSARFLKSNIDTITAHAFDPGATPFSRKLAAKNLLKIVASIAAVLTTAKLLDDDSVDLDPRSANFGKIQIGNTRFDLTGGMSSLVTLASRLVPTKHNGEWGFWTKSSTSDRFTNLTADKFGQNNAVDTFVNFFLNKLAPVPGVVRDVWKGEDFSGNKMTPLNIVKNLTVPIPITTYMELREDPASANIIASMILEGLGISANTYGGGGSKSKFKGFSGDSETSKFKGF